MVPQPKTIHESRGIRVIRGTRNTGKGIYRVVDESGRTIVTLHTAALAITFANEYAADSPLLAQYRVA
jgi:hypothetical protein